MRIASPSNAMTAPISSVCRVGRDRTIAASPAMKPIGTRLRARNLSTRATRPRSVWLPALAGRLRAASDFRLKAEATRVEMNAACERCS
jgi:hypothetical protein